MQILILIVQNSFPISQVGTATASNNYFRQVGASLGSAVVGSLFVARPTQLLTDRMPGGGNTAAGSSNSFTPGQIWPRSAMFARLSRVGLPHLTFPRLRLELAI